MKKAKMKYANGGSKKGRGNKKQGSKVYERGGGGGVSRRGKKERIDSKESGIEKANTLGLIREKKPKVSRKREKEGGNAARCVKRGREEGLRKKKGTNKGNA